jgi:hypothetical protein
MSCLMSIAATQASPVYSEFDALKLVQSYLLSLHRDDIDPHLMLYEMAQFFGFFVPPAPGKWEFVHRTIQDYLAARFIVESGRLREVSSDFDFRAAQAACITPDPEATTEFMIRALRFGSNMVAFHECLYNRASFHAPAVARALIVYYLERFPSTLELDVTFEGVLRAVMSDNWVRSAPADLLMACLREALEREGNEPTCLIAACLCELRERQSVIPDVVLESCLERFRGAKSILVLMDDQSRIMTLSELRGQMKGLC